jgi:DnaJ-class molecular chaperone
MIPKSWEDRDFYKELRVDKAASFSVIKASYRELVKTLHPDVNQGVNLNDE